MSQDGEVKNQDLIREYIGMVIGKEEGVRSKYWSNFVVLKFH